MPIHNIISIISQVDFSIYNINLLRDLVTIIVTYHFEEPETLQLLHKLKQEKLQNLSFEDFVSFFSCFINIDIFNILNEPHKDLYYEKTIEQKEKKSKH